MGAVLGGEGEEVMPFLFGKTIDVKERNVEGDGRQCCKRHLTCSGATPISSSRTFFILFSPTHSV
jgi:hypothetical protein